MKKEKAKKKLTFNKLAIRNLGLKQVNVLVKDEVKVIKSDDDNTSPLCPGLTEHPKYC